VVIWYATEVDTAARTRATGASVNSAMFVEAADTNVDMVQTGTSAESESWQETMVYANPV